MECVADWWSQLLYVDRHDDTNGKFSHPQRSVPESASTARKTNRYASAENQEDAGGTDEFMMDCLGREMYVYM
jgi:hypothetical protein